MNLDIFHDATLLTLSFDYENGEGEITLKTQSNIVKLSVYNIQEAIIPRANPWGKSISINEIIYDSEVLKIQMQSGDLIKINCKLQT
jgi:hypothetical protein